MAEMFKSRVDDSHFRRIVSSCDGCFQPSEFKPGEDYRPYVFSHPNGTYGTAYFPSEAAARHARKDILGETGYSGIPEHQRCTVSRA
jgi:hypothetical protein